MKWISLFICPCSMLCYKAKITYPLDLIMISCHDGTVQLFFKKSEDETFCEWDLELQPEDPHYKYDPDTTILLKDKYPLLNVYDEQVFHHIIFYG
ncbi:hypothetical protein [Cronobacter sakazakii]|uniref:hypothetical protein n=1 Tax=Cronobacter sakazakii TaxID=28141 RepID=UPI0010566CEC|nr:hypothetical protein [Cronobacter sakazakii]EJK9929306.1 hypothetical protein [Cronobacter sakazakii]ELY3796867.1 hypothetical protein [Cronobacter sakazakii]ELY3830456.1 hypothetical protein [Cronobacter sakazakii]